MSRIAKSIWLRRVGPLSLAGALVLPAAVNGSEGASAKGEADVKTVYEANKDAMQKLFGDFENQRRDAMSKAGEGKYLEALNELNALLKKVDKRPGDLARSMSEEINGNITRIQRVWSSEIMQEAQKFAKEKKYVEAIDKAQQAQKLTPARESIGKFISECQKYESARPFKEDTSLAKVVPDYEKRQKELDVALREAKIFFRNKRYETAAQRLERVLIDDPFNVEAVDMLAHCYDRLFNYGKARSQETEALQNARSVWEWVDPLTAVQVDYTTDRSGTVRKQSDSDLYNRLERIVFPTVPLKDTTLSQIISYLNEKSRTYDPDKQGVTILDNLSRADKERKVSLELGRVPLLDIIRYLSMASGVSYSFRGDKVIFGTVDNMSTEIFPVHGDIIAQIIDSKTVRATDSGMTGPEEDGGGGDNAPADAPPADPTMMAEDPGMMPGEEGAATTANAAALKADSAALKAYFAERWITFDNGADIIYSPRGQQLLVRNTPENLRRIDALLRQLDAVEQPMVMVEAKLIELTDTNLNELGFEWMFSAGPNSGNKWSVGVVDPTRHGANGEMFRVLNNFKIFPNFGNKIFGHDTHIDLSLSINAVAQNRRSEVLASPRILTESGAKDPAMIKMIEKTYFITEWDEPDVETDGFNISIESTDPEWDDAYDLGVTFSVKPTVKADNYTITLNDIHPIFLSHINDYDFIVTYEAGIIGPDGSRQPVNSQTFNLRMPEIARREMTTSITLYDGETVLIGGMADNESTTRDDKWPILGDIPLLGRLFRDEMTNVTNRTMLIFITARLVRPNGLPVRSARDQGLIDFNR